MREDSDPLVLEMVNERLAALSSACETVKEPAEVFAGEELKCPISAATAR